MGKIKPGRRVLIRHSLFAISQHIPLMNVSPPKQQPKWLQAQVAAGHFASIDEALAVAVADLRALSEDDLAWARPYVIGPATRSHAAT